MYSVAVIETLDFDIQLIMGRDGSFPSVSAIATPFGSHVDLLNFDGKWILECDIENSLFCGRSAAFNSAAPCVDVDSFLSVEVFTRVDEH